MTIFSKLDFGETLSIALVLGVFSVWPPVSLHAQGVERESRIELIPRVGYRVLDKLGHLQPHQTAGSGQAVLRGGINDSPIVGLGISLPLQISWLRLDLGLDRTLGADIVTINQTLERLGNGSFSHVRQDVDAALWLGSLEVRWTPAPASWPVRPYAVGGSGFKYFSVDQDERREIGVGGGRLLIDGAIHVGGGTDFTVAEGRFQLAVTDHISFDDGTPVHDLVIGLGARIPLN